ncbi:fasciclin domain-containing protein [Mucilaginibacter sp. L3T2-6]|uniref:fasciclin domain-containing protein n=1 Tax=Mucilaginibacter sp. L3T2-6 TaxID=3062491 RepID=UPI002676AA16|nr:fasciclin domain-containing protein [Mucilaginibacter sp. L3T2-6]MDO3640959.1 fasciclin domain-containing protein [Mucilaginibacter sp. L3T2-6]MDV6213565.1 fasciclin domain-containing protein [Mucilaginibacter sp. L3T2-6]
MKKSIVFVAAVVIGLMSTNVFAQTTPATPKPATPPAQPTTTPAQQPAATTAPAAADSVKNVEATLANVADLTSLVGAIKAAKVDSALMGPGPFTVFAPDNAAFSAIPKEKLDSLMKDPVKLAKLVNAHVIAGKYDKAGIIKALTNAQRTAVLKTVDGQTITISVVDKKLQLKDADGNTAQVTSFDTPATNGVIHGINGVLMYK